MNENTSPKSVMDSIKSLRRYTGDETEFWNTYLQQTAILCKSPISLCLVKEEAGWRLLNHFLSEEHLKAHLDELASLAVSMAERVLDKGFAFERVQMGISNIRMPFALVFGADTANKFIHTIVLIISDRSSTQSFNEVIVRTQLISDIPSSYYLNRTTSQLPEVSNRSTAMLTQDVPVIAAAVMQKDAFTHACITMANEVAHRFNCKQVSIGWLDGQFVKTTAISHVESFDKNSDAVIALCKLYEEAHDQRSTICSPKVDNSFFINIEHEKYCKANDLTQVVSVPFMLHDSVVGVLTCEKRGDFLNAADISALNILTAQIAPWFNVLHYKKMWLPKKALVKTKQSVGSLLGLEHTFVKLVGLILGIVFFISIIFDWPYRVEGSALIKTDAISYISAPFDGIVKEVAAQEGEDVRKDSLLLRLDTTELYLRESQIASDIIRYAREADKARAMGYLADMKIALARKVEAEASLQKVRYFIDNAEIRAAFDGVVVQGDKQKLKSAPVSKGDVLMKIAKIEGMYAYIKVSEKDISEIKSGAKGELIFLSRPWNTYKLTVDKIVPMAEVDAREGNVFAVKAKIEDKPEDWWRPGMSGVAKIDAGDKKIIWIWTHKLIDFIRIYLWW